MSESSRVPPRRRVTRRILSLFAAVSMVVAVAGAGQESPSDQLADALKAIKDGNFDRANALMRKSAAGGDAQAKGYSEWTAGFEKDHEVFVEQRRRKYEWALDAVRKLADAKEDEVAIQFAANRAYVYAEDKQKFADSELVTKLIERSAQLAAQHEASAEWIKAQRLYTYISMIEPYEPKWKDRKDTVARRVRILAMYSPEAIKAQRAEDLRTADEIQKFLPPEIDDDGNPVTRPTTAPTVAGATTAPTTAPADDEDAAEDPFKVDWRDSLKGIRAELLFNGLMQVRGNYWRDVDFRKVVNAGFEGVRTLLTTQGVSATFPTLNDKDRAKALLAKLDQLEADVRGSDASMAGWTFRQAYEALLKANKETVDLPEEVVVFEFGDAALAACDPFTNMLWPSQLDEFTKNTQGEFFGVGIQIREGDDGFIKVASPIEDSPAYRAGIKAGDSITHVDGKSIKGITSTQAVKVITGARGTPVTLTIRSFDGAVKNYTLVRDTIHVSSLKGFVRRADNAWDYFIDPENKIAYVRITTFSATTAADLERATAEMSAKGMKGMILDLRYNPGGLLTAAIEVVNRFVDKGVVVSTHPDRQTNTEPASYSAHPEPDGVKVPLVVLVNQYSASASEIVSGALKDQGRAVIVGERSFGKGSVQQMFQLGPASAKTVIKLTTAHYYLPSGRCLHRDEDSRVWGVDPDVKVEMMPEQMLLAQKALNEFDVLHAKGETVDSAATTRSVAGMTDHLIKSDSQLSAALLLLRLQLHGAQVAQGTVAPGVAAEPQAR